MVEESYTWSVYNYLAILKIWPPSIVYRSTYCSRATAHRINFPEPSTVAMAGLLLSQMRSKPLRYVTYVKEFMSPTHRSQTSVEKSILGEIIDNSQVIRVRPHSVNKQISVLPSNRAETFPVPSTVAICSSLLTHLTALS